MTGQQLKNSILQMAVQGKLVPQDPKDEPASVLLERIRKEKEQLIKEGKIKKEKNHSYIFRGADNLPYEKVGKKEPVCIADEVPFEIPESWEWVRLEMIAVTELGKTLNKAENQGYYKPYLCSINVYWTGIDLSTIKDARFEESELSKYRLRKGDLLICEGGDVGRSAIWENEQEMYYQNALHRVRFYGGINPYYFRLLLECYKGNKILDENSKGMTIKHLVKSALNAIYFPLPPIKEQQRIIDKFQSLSPLLERYNAIEERLSSLNARFPNLLKKSILQEAVQGKLVPQNPADEPASVLLERIRAEKEHLIQEKKIKRDKHESVIYRRDNSHYEKLDGIEHCIDDEIPFELPKNWCWCRLGNIIQSIDAGKSFKCDERPPEQNEYGIIKVSAVTWGIFKQEESKTCFLTSQWITDYAIQLGDFLICRANTAALVGGCVIVEKISKKLMLSDKVLRINFFNSVNKLYALYILRSPFVRTQLSAAANGTSESMKNISQNIIKRILIPFPPIEEQYRIVSKIEELLPQVMTL